MPLAWKNLAERGDAPPDVSLVITGTLEPPVRRLVGFCNC